MPSEFPECQKLAAHQKCLFKIPAGLRCLFMDTVILPTVRLLAYLACVPTEEDRELKSDIACELAAEFVEIRGCHTDCRFSERPFAELDKLDYWVFVRAEENSGDWPRTREGGRPVLSRWSAAACVALVGLLGGVRGQEQSQTAEVGDGWSLKLSADWFVLRQVMPVRYRWMDDMSGSMPGATFTATKDRTWALELGYRAGSFDDHVFSDPRPPPCVSDVQMDQYEVQMRGYWYPAELRGYGERVRPYLTAGLIRRKSDMTNTIVSPDDLVWWTTDTRVYEIVTVLDMPTVGAGADTVLYQWESGATLASRLQADALWAICDQDDDLWGDTNEGAPGCRLTGSVSLEVPVLIGGLESAMFLDVGCQYERLFFGDVKGPPDEDQPPMPPFWGETDGIGETILWGFYGRLGARVRF